MILLTKPTNHASLIGSKFYPILYQLRNNPPTHQTHILPQRAELQIHKMLSSLISDIVSAFTITEVEAEAPAPVEKEDKQVEQKEEKEEAPAEPEEEEEEPEDTLPKLQEGKSRVPED